MAVWSLWGSYVTWSSFACDSQKPTWAIVSTKPMSHKNTTSNWDTKENSESLCLHLLSVYLLHLSFFFCFPVCVPTSQHLTRLHSTVQQPKERDWFSLSIFPAVSYSLSLSPTSLFQNSQDENRPAWVRYWRQDQSTVEIRPWHKVGKRQDVQLRNWWKHWPFHNVYIITDTELCANFTAFMKPL